MAPMPWIGFPFWSKPILKARDVSDHVFSSLFYSPPILIPLSHVKHHKLIYFNLVISLVAIPLLDPWISLGLSCKADLRLLSALEFWAARHGASLIHVVTYCGICPSLPSIFREWMGWCSVGDSHQCDLVKKREKKVRKSTCKNSCNYSR